jgi:hypothetical protein
LAAARARSSIAQTPALEQAAAGLGGLEAWRGGVCPALHHNLPGHGSDSRTGVLLASGTQTQPLNPSTPLHHQDRSLCPAAQTKQAEWRLGMFPIAGTRRREGEGMRESSCWAAHEKQSSPRAKAEKKREAIGALWPALDPISSTASPRLSPPVNDLDFPPSPPRFQRHPISNPPRVLPTK